MRRQRHFSADTFELYFNLFVVFLTAAIFFGAVGGSIYGLFIRTTAINQECGTNYNVVQVATGGDTLMKLCQMKKQEITLKK